MNVLIDIDGVLADVVNGALTVLKERYGVCHGKQASDWKTYNAEECFDIPPDAMREIFSTAHFYMDLAPMPLAGWMARQLCAAGDNIHLVTAHGTFVCSLPEIQQVTRQWLLKHNIPFHTLAFDRYKATYARDHEIDLEIEDSPKNALDLSFICPTILVDAAYTGGMPDLKQLHRQCDPITVVKVAKYYREMGQCS